MVRRIVSLLLALLLVAALGSASASTLIDGSSKRDITIHEAGLNEVEEGISPTTGLPLADYYVPSGFTGLAATGRYMPMMVQIDNYIGGVNELAPWGANYVDVVYETPLHAAGYTRISFLFSDLIPDAVGPVRSARVAHVWIRQEWGAGFMYYGGQEVEGSDITEELRRLGAKIGEVNFSGTVGKNKAWKKFYSVRKGTDSPHDKNGNAAGISELIPESITAPNHAYLFTDDLPTGGDTADEVHVVWGAVNYCSALLYSVDDNVYYRYMERRDGTLIPYEDKDTHTQLGFANVIVQYAKTTYNGSAAAPVTTVTGSGNADYFQGGQHLAGVWQRKDMNSRTVFYGPDGEELPMQRGKTLIIIVPPKNEIRYQ